MPKLLPSIVPGWKGFTGWGANVRLMTLGNKMNLPLTLKGIFIGYRVSNW